MTSKYVIDAELFKVFGTGSDYDSAVDAIGDLIKKGHKSVADEATHFLNLLHFVADENAIICYNDKILEEYWEYVKKAPSDIEELTNHIFSNKRCSKRMNQSSKFQEIENIFDSALLRRKTKYLDLAYSLKEKTFLSTKEDIKNIYEPNISKLETFGIRVKDVSSWEEQVENSSIGLTTFIASDCWTPNDELGFSTYAYAIYKFLINKDTKPPLTISIQAPWGGGKTSLMRMIQKNLDPNALEKYLEYKGRTFNGKSYEERNGSFLINLKSWFAYYGYISDLFKQRNNKKIISSFCASDVIFENNLVKLKDSTIPKEIRKVIKKQNKLTIDQACSEINTFSHGKKPKFEIPEFEKKDRRLTIWFNVWKYENTEQVWAGLADAIIGQFGERLEPIQREKFWLYLHYRRLDPDKVRNTIYTHILAEFLHNMRFWFLGALSMSIVLLYSFAVKINSPFIPITGWSIISILIVKGFFQYQDEKKKPAEVSISKYLRVPDYNAKLGFMHFAEEDLKYVLEDLITKPIVIFIDDLDRCSPDKVADLTEAINLFLAGEFKNCIFVLGMDPEIVAASLEEAHSRMISKLPSGAKNTPIGWRFMDKFVQLPFVIPLADKNCLDNYVKSLLSDYIGIEMIDRKVKDDIEEELSEIEDFAQIEPVSKKYTEKYNLNKDQQYCINQILTQNVRFKKVDRGIASFSDKNSDILKSVMSIAPEFSRNPRDLKRFFNIFRFLYFLKWAGEEDRSSSLSLEQLCRWIVLSMKWPEVERWLRYSYGRQEGWTIEENIIPASTNRLRLLEEIGAHSKSMDNWLSEIEDKLQLTLKDAPWIADDDLRKFFHREGNFEMKDRLSYSSGMGLW